MLKKLVKWWHDKRDEDARREALCIAEILSADEKRAAETLKEESSSTEVTIERVESVAAKDEQEIQQKELTHDVAHGMESEAVAHVDSKDGAHEKSSGIAAETQMKKVCTKCGSVVEIEKPKGKMSIGSTIAAIVSIVLLACIILAYVSKEDANSRLTGRAAMILADQNDDNFFLVCLIFGVPMLYFAGVALSGYQASQMVNDKDCPQCDGKNTLIGIGTPTGQKIIRENGEKESGDPVPQTEESKGSAICFCPQCGSPRQKDDKFCRNCGNGF